MFNGRNSQFDKIVKVLSFFGLDFEYNIFKSDEDVVDNKKYKYIKNIDTEVTDVEKELITMMLSLDNNTKETLKNLITKIN